METFYLALEAWNPYNDWFTICILNTLFTHQLIWVQMNLAIVGNNYPAKSSFITFFYKINLKSRVKYVQSYKI